VDRSGGGEIGAHASQQPLLHSEITASIIGSFRCRTVSGGAVHYRLPRMLPVMVTLLPDLLAGCRIPIDGSSDRRADVTNANDADTTSYQNAYASGNSPMSQKKASRTMSSRLSHMSGWSD